MPNTFKISKQRLAEIIKEEYALSLDPTEIGERSPEDETAIVRALEKVGLSTEDLQHTLSEGEAGGFTAHHLAAGLRDLAEAIETADITSPDAPVEDSLRALIHHEIANL